MLLLSRNVVFRRSQILRWNDLLLPLILNFEIHNFWFEVHDVKTLLLQIIINNVFWVIKQWWRRFLIKFLGNLNWGRWSAVRFLSLVSFVLNYWFQLIVKSFLSFEILLSCDHGLKRDLRRVFRFNIPNRCKGLYKSFLISVSRQKRVFMWTMGSNCIVLHHWCLSGKRTLLATHS